MQKNARLFDFLIVIFFTIIDIRLQTIQER